MGFRDWLRDRHETRRWLWIGLACAVIVIVTVFGGGKQLKDAYEGMTSADQITKLSTFFSGTSGRANPVTLVAIDDESRAAWGQPPATPHGALAVLIRLAREAKAKAILVDIDLSPDSTFARPDLALNAELTTYPADAPLLMLARAIRFRGGQDKSAFEPDTAAVTPYDAAVRNKSNVVWAAAVPDFGADRVVRKIALWQTVCDGARGATFASPALHVAALDGERTQALAAFLAAETGLVCGKSGETHDRWPARRDNSARIPFIIWGDGSTIGREAASGGTPLIQVAAAFRLVGYDGGRASARGAISPSLFAGRVAVIGATHADTRDIHATPLGSMPGVVVLANTVAMAAAIVDTPELMTGGKLVYAVPAFIVLGLLGIRLQLAAATLIVGSLALALLVILSRLLGFAAASEIMAYVLVMYGLLKLSDSLLTILHDWRKGVGWRAIFKPRH